MPNSDFASANSNPYVYLYSKFGVHDGAHGGFVESAPVSCAKPPVVGPPPPPPPAPATLSGTVFLDGAGTGVLDPSDLLVVSTVMLTGTNSQGQAVTLSTTSAADGTYSFTGLLPGTYTITDAPPSSFTAEQVDVGTVNGVVNGSASGASAIGSIVVAAGQSGINYNFALTNFVGGG